MNTKTTTKEEILGVSRQLVKDKGWSSLNIRNLAKANGVSIGTIYNYFDSKSDLVSSTVESVWWDIFHPSQGQGHFETILTTLEWIYKQMEYGDTIYPDFFAFHSKGVLSMDKKDSSRLMEKTWHHILDKLCLTLKNDPNISPSAFTERLSREDFAEILLCQILASQMRKNYNPYPLMELTKKSLY